MADGAPGRLGPARSHRLRHGLFHRPGLRRHRHRGLRRGLIAPNRAAPRVATDLQTSRGRAPPASSPRMAHQSWRAGLVAIVFLVTGCGDTSGVASSAATGAEAASPSAVATTPVPSAAATASAPQTPSPTAPTSPPPTSPPTLAPKTPTPATPTPRPPTSTATVIPPPQTQVGPTPTWTATPNPSLPPGVSGCLSNRARSTTDCVARHLPPGAGVTETVNEVGMRTFVVNWLPPVDVNGNVPFPYNRPSAGKTIFTTSAGGVTVTFEVDFV